MEWILAHLTGETVIPVVISILSGLFWFTRRKIIPWVRKNLQVLPAITELSKKVEEIQTLVKRELNPNHGSSIKDALTELRLNVSLLDGKFRAYVSQTEMMCWEGDRDGNILWVSNRLAEVLGRNEDDLLGYGWRAFIAPEDRERVISEVAQAIQEKRAFMVEVNMVRRDGKRVRMLFVSNPVRTYDDNIWGRFGTVSVVPDGNY